MSTLYGSNPLSKAQSLFPQVLTIRFPPLIVFTAKEQQRPLGHTIDSASKYCASLVPVLLLFYDYKENRDTTVELLHLEGLAALLML